MAVASPAQNILMIRTSEFLVATAVILILTVMVIPIPTVMLDVLLSFSITFSLVILLVSVFMLSPLDFSVFPSLLLMVTLIRLSLNVASTRIILLHGNEGPGAAGKVIQSFGSFVVGGNLVVGAVIFMILVMINFIVITRGSVRTSEVAAPRENGVPLVEDKSLAQSLYKTADIGQIIPERLYRAVAEILAYAYRLKGKTSV